MNGKPTPIRIDEATLGRLDRIAAEMTKRAAGVEVARAAVIRAAIDRGAESLETELGMSVKKRKAKK